MHKSGLPQEGPAGKSGVALDAALRRSLLGRIEGAEKRWARAARKGRSDTELKAMIAEEYGISGGFCGPGMTYEYKGGRQPAFWLGFRRAKPKPTLAGRRLVEEVRRVMEIRQ